MRQKTAEPTPHPLLADPSRSPILLSRPLPPAPAVPPGNAARKPASTHLPPPLQNALHPVIELRPAPLAIRAATLAEPAVASKYADCVHDTSSAGPSPTTPGTSPPDKSAP